MKCHEARELFSPYLDGELAAAEINILEQHLRLCPDCREELGRWQEMSRALKGLAAPVKAPPDFSAAVMARVKTPAAAQGRAKLLQQRLRRWAAAAAAVAVLAAGTLSYAGRGLWQQLPLLANDPPGKQVAVEEPGPEVKLPPLNKGPAGNEPATPADPEPGNEGKLPGDEGQQQGTETGDRGSSPELDPGKEQGSTEPGSGEAAGVPMQIAGGETYTPRTFLSANGRQTTSTLLKISVDDLAAAATQVANLAAGSGASLQLVDGQEQRFVYQLSVNKDKAGALLDSLSRVGRVTSRNDSKRDLSEQFSATLEQYQAKVAQANSTTEEAEKEKLLQEAKNLEQQLLAWEQESKEQTIVLWLEANKQ